MENKQRLLIVSLISIIFGFLLASKGWAAFYRITNIYYEFNAENIGNVFQIASGAYSVTAFLFSVIAAFYLSKSHLFLTWVPAVIFLGAQFVAFDMRSMPLIEMAGGITIFNLPALIGGFLPMMVKGIKSICASPNRSTSHLIP